MKRSPLLRRTRLAPVSSKRAAAMPAYRAAKAALPERCEGQVEGVCTGTAQDAHHVKPRGRGGKLLPGEGQRLAGLCRKCHEWAHANTRQARELGLLK